MTSIISRPNIPHDKPASTDAERKADALCEDAIIAAANGSYHKVKNHRHSFAEKLIRKYGFKGTNDLIDGAFRTSNIRLKKYGLRRRGNRNYAVEIPYRDFLKKLRKTCRKIRERRNQRLQKRQNK
jgi:hypothetical protein